MAKESAKPWMRGPTAASKSTGRERASEREVMPRLSSDSPGRETAARRASSLSGGSEEGVGDKAIGVAKGPGEDGGVGRGHGVCDLAVVEDELAAGHASDDGDAVGGAEGGVDDPGGVLGVAERRGRPLPLI